MVSRPPENVDPLRELGEKLRQGSRDSFRLLENFRDNPICSINHDEACGCIMVIWRQYATQVEFRYIHEKLLSLICERNVDKILGDDTALPAIARRIGSGLSTTGFHAPCNVASALLPAKCPNPTSPRSLLAISSRPLRLT